VPDFSGELDQDWSDDFVYLHNLTMDRTFYITIL
jgi:hypothetical protein